MPTTQQIVISDGFDDEFDDEDLRLLQWFEQATTEDPILLNVRRILANGEPLSSFHWRLLKRAYDEADWSRYHYGSQLLRRADRLARQQAEAIARREAKTDQDDETEILGIAARVSVGIEPTLDELRLLENRSAVATAGSGWQL